MTMLPLTGKMPRFIAGVVILGNLPLLAFILLFWQVMAARTAGHAGGGDAIGLAIMSVLAYGLALASFAIGAAYFGYKFTRHKLRPQGLHKIALAWSSIELAVPLLYFLIT
ncbi:hypothetical protein [Pseudoduganella sp. OTU4001]|uniref:hypothetical protein n=1 Tax=Pseudoduganella sp. OTU4001 TaxID=3043854 RepID=UPI00313C55B6